MTLDLTGDEGDAVDTIWWLRNGGGKSSLFALFYSLVLPEKRDFIGHAKKKSLADYVAGNAVAHVVAEWGDDTGIAAGTALVTGGVYQWRDFHRPHDPDLAWDRLQRSWYLFRPVESVLTLDTLPVASDDGRLPRETYLKTLTAIMERDRRIDLSIARQPGEWERTLRNVGLDPRIFKVQREMNRDEGAITELFSFDTPEKFAEFLIDLVVDHTLPAKVRSNLEQQGRTIAQRPARETEQRFLSTARARLEPVREAVQAMEHCGQHLAETSRAVRRAREHIQHRAEARDADAATAEIEGQEANALASAAYTRRTNAQRRAAALERLTARLTVQEATAEFEQAKTERERCERREQAWRAVPALSRATELEDTVRELADKLARQEAHEAPSRDARHRAAAALRDRLLAAAASAEDEQKSAEEEKAAAERRAQHEEEQHREALLAANSAAQKARTIRKNIRELESEERGVRDEGLVLAEETVADAEHRYGDEKTTAIESCRQLKATVDRLDAERQRLDKEHLERVPRIQEARHKHDNLADDIGRLRDEQEALARLPRLVELAGLEDDAVIDLDIAGRRLVELLTEQVAMAEARLVAEELSAADDRRAQLALSHTGFLPPPLEIEQAIDALTAVGATAVSGLEYLRQTVPADRHDEVLNAAPGIAGGVVVLGEIPDGDLPALVVKTDVNASAVVQVNAEGKVRAAFAEPLPSASDDTAIVPVRRGLLDRNVADDEESEIGERLAGLEQRRREIERSREDDRALATRLRAHLEAFDAPRREALSEQLSTLDRQLKTLVAADERTQAQREKLAAELSEAQDERERLSTQIAELAELLPRVKSLAARLAEVPELREQESEADTEERRQSGLADEAKAAGAIERTAAGTWMTRAALRGADADRYRNESTTVDVPDDVDSGLPAEQQSTMALDALRRRYGDADIAWRAALGDSALRAKLDAAKADLTNVQESLSAYNDTVVSEARALLNTPDATEHQRRQAAAQEALQQRREADSKHAAAELQLNKANAVQNELGRGEEAEGEAATDLGPMDYTTAKSAREAWDVAIKDVNDARSKANEEERRREAKKSEAERARQDASSLRGSDRVLDVAIAQVPHAAGVDDGEEPDDLLDREYGLTAAKTAELTVDDAAQLERQLQQRVETQRTAYDVAHHELSSAAGKLRTFAQQDAYRAIDRRLIARLSDEADVLRRTVDELLGDVKLRESIVANALAAIKHDQQLLIQQCASLVKSVVDDLDQVSRHSVLPKGLHNWSGERFLMLQITKWGNDDELHRRLGTEIDRLVAGIKPEHEQKATVLPEPMAMTKRLLLAALGGAGHITAKVLKPKPALVVERVSVTQIQKFSGGELLTVSVLLYCTLAKLRVANRGKNAPGGVGALLLDNPFGKATYVLFVKLQRQVAEAHGIQVVYATAVHDLLAVGQFPLVLRMRNQTDERTRRQYVQVVERYGDALEAAVDRARDDTITGTRLYRRPLDEDETPEEKSA